MTPSNPATFFVSGSEHHDFHYEPGPDPYYVIFHTKSYILLSVMVFASSAVHALDITKQMIDFMEECSKQYAKREAKRYNKHDLIGRHQRKVNELRKPLNLEEGYSIYINKADRTQMFKIGWADNDTI